jgi:sigma-B regulation protein RsbU (phosphoserine phosphatase)
MNILVAEDDFVSRRILQQSLRRSSHEVMSVGNGREAWDAFERQHFSLVITDWNMPDVDGIELIRRIRASERPGYVYVVLLTGKSQKEDLIAGMEAGADDFMTKPFDEGELKARLRAARRVLALEQRLAHQNDELQGAYARLMATNERLRQDRVTAARVQRSLLPPAHLEVPGLQLAWSFRPCDELAGDIFNVVPLDEDHVALYVLDVSSHGVAAALLAVTLSRLLSANMHQSTLLKRPAAIAPGYTLATPSEVAGQLNSQFPMQSATGQYFTLLYGVLHVPSGRFTFAQAGHPGPLVMRHGRAHVLAPDHAGPPIGFLDAPTYADREIMLSIGDRLLLYSDGLPESQDAQGQFFGEERLTAAVERTVDLTLDGGLSRVVEDVAEWSGARGFTDDVSMLAVELAGEDPVPTEDSCRSGPK